MTCFLLSHPIFRLLAKPARKSMTSFLPFHLDHCSGLLTHLPTSTLPSLNRAAKVPLLKHNQSAHPLLRTLQQFPISLQSKSKRLGGPTWHVPQIPLGSHLCFFHSATLASPILLSNAPPGCKCSLEIATILYLHVPQFSVQMTTSSRLPSSFT